MSRPQVIDDQEHERVHDRVAAIDVAKDAGWCALAPRTSSTQNVSHLAWAAGARRASRD